MQHLKALLISLVLTVAALSLSGCTQMGYNLGSMLPPEIQSVYVPTFVNTTDEPQLGIEATRSVIKALQLDGSLDVATEKEADAVLKAKLIDYRLVPIGYRKDRPTATDEYRIFLTAAFSLTRTSNGEVVAQSSRVMGDTTFVLEGDMTSAKRLALPDAADDLAHDIVEKIVEYW